MITIVKNEVTGFWDVLFNGCVIYNHISYLRAFKVACTQIGAINS